MKLFTKSFIVLFFIGIFFGCSKQQAETGPQGAQGYNGAPGNANVKSIIDSVNKDTLWTFANGQWYVYFVNPYLNASFIKSGGFAEIFLSTDNQKTWTILPTILYWTPTQTAQWTYSYTTSNLVYIFYTWNDQLQHTGPNTTYGATCYFNVVCLAPAIIKKYPGTNWNSYKAISHIPELIPSLNATKKI